MYIREAGDNLDFLKRTKYGANALQLARNSKVPECVLVLEKATEAAAKAAQDALLQELEREGEKKDKHHTPQPHPHVKKPKRKKALPAPSGEHFSIAKKPGNNMDCCCWRTCTSMLYLVMFTTMYWH